MQKKPLTPEELLASDKAVELIADLTFEDGLKILDQLVERVESGSLSLDSAINGYERGVLIIERLRSQLQRAEEKLQVLDKGTQG